MTRAGLERAGRMLTALFGVGFLLLGLRYFADPGALTVETDVAMPSIKAVMEIRTVYGGMFVGVGLATALLGWRDTTMRAALWVLALVAGSVALARLAAIALGQAPDPLFAALLAIEIVGVALAAWVLRRLAAGTDP
ncbi:DUF4345 family protein [Sphingopyxis sp. LK2115]|jgi:hypothetical protein|uniref:DUF4345 family protein n=1 Tax=Sphingopyxis sp. LK2115 TaxID=2744558 RepID=UPI001661835A|nr:DUF4345 family protein [Sphingopyxis sp. LK2115]